MPTRQGRASEFPLCNTLPSGTVCSMDPPHRRTSSDHSTTMIGEHEDLMRITEEGVGTHTQKRQESTKVTSLVVVDLDNFFFFNTRLFVQGY